jgi:hypothetical protein
MFEFLINRTHERTPVFGQPAFAICEVDSGGLRIIDYGTDALRPWSDVHAVHALSRTPMVADSLALVITFSDNRVALVSDEDAQWYALALALPQRLSGVPTYTEWSMRLRADPQATLQLF